MFGSFFHKICRLSIVACQLSLVENNIKGGIFRRAMCEKPQFTWRNSAIKREENKFTYYPEREQNR